MSTRGRLKEGYKSSEFWVVMAATIITQLGDAGLFEGKSPWLLALAGIYAVARSYLKSQTAKAIAIEAVAGAPKVDIEKAASSAARKAVQSLKK